MGAAKIKSNRKLVLAGMFISSILVDGGFFPIVNLNPDKPVELDMTMRLAIIAMAVVFHKAIGSAQAAVLPECSGLNIGLLNLSMVSCGLLCRYLLEFGEASNTYNFTMLNTSVHVAASVFISTASCLLGRHNK